MLSLGLELILYRTCLRPRFHHYRSVQNHLLMNNHQMILEEPAPDQFSKPHGRLPTGSLVLAHHHQNMRVNLPTATDHLPGKRNGAGNDTKNISKTTPKTVSPRRLRTPGFLRSPSFHPLRLLTQASPIASSRQNDFEYEFQTQAQRLQLSKQALA